MVDNAGHSLLAARHSFQACNRLLRFPSTWNISTSSDLKSLGFCAEASRMEKKHSMVVFAEV
jgi:hypothetical protein